MLPHRLTTKADLVEECDLGYMICRVVRTYGMGYREVMDLPMPVFWQMSGNVGRLRAEEEQLRFQVGVSLQNTESAETMRKYLDKLAPGFLKLNGLSDGPELDSAGLDELRALV